MRGHLVGFQFCPVLLSGVALFFVAFSSSLHTDLSRDEVFERVEGNTWMCYTSVITPWYFFPTFYTLLIPLYTLLATTNPSFRRNVNVSGSMGESRIGWHFFGCHDKLHIIPSPLPSGGGRRERKGHSIFVVTISRVSQFSLVTPLNSVSDDWSYLRSLLKPGDPPPHPQDPLTLQPLFPSEKWWPIPYFCSALFRECKVYDLLPFLITFPFS